MKDLKLKKRGKKILFVTHNLNYEGASLWLFNLANGLKKRGHHVEILSPCTGPIEPFYLKEKIKINVSNYSFQNFNLLNFGKKFDSFVVNTIMGYKFIKNLNFEKRKVVWCLHESERDFYLKHFKDLDKKLFSQVNKVVFSSVSTKKVYEELNTKDNFFIINTVGDWSKIDKFIQKKTKKNVMMSKGFNKNDFLVNIIGTICLRKGQLEFTEVAIEILKKLKNPQLKFVMIGGGRGYEYEKAIVKLIRLSGLQDQIIIVNETKDIFNYYFISDIFVCNSYIEAFPMVILEAMAFSLPIVSTDAYGIAEQLEDEKSGFLIMPGDKETLRKKIMFLIKNKDIAKKLGKNARKRLEEKFSYEKMIDQYDALISEVCHKNE